MRVEEVMTPVPRPLLPTTTLLEAARRMSELGVPVLPVSEDERLVGMLTERDLILGAVLEDDDGDAVPATEGRVARAMHLDPPTCHPDEELGDVLDHFEGMGVRHLVVVDPEDHPLGVLPLRREWKSTAPARQPFDAELRERLDDVDLASRDSFPASDPPAWIARRPRRS